MTSVRETLQRRKLVHWILAYLAFSWLLLRVIDTLGGKFGWPDSWFRIATVVLAVVCWRSAFLPGTTASAAHSAQPDSRSSC